MKFLAHLRTAVMATLVLVVACCVVYPLAVFGFAQALFPGKANGSLIRDSHGVVRGSRLLGQNFSDAAYFHSRPSAAGNGYDAANSGGSNLGPTSQKLYDTLRARIADYRKENGLKETEPVPADAVTTSASGLDPHISPRNAELQAARVTRVRGLKPEIVRRLIAENTDQPDLYVLGEPGVNVLTLNLALDSLKAGK